MKINIAKKFDMFRKEKTEVKNIKVDHKTIMMAKNAWSIMLSFVGGLFASVGAYSIIHPVLRMEMLTLFGQFFDEVGLMF